MEDSEVKLPRIPEAVLKRRKQASANKSKALKAEAANRKKLATQKRKRFSGFQRAEKFVKKCRLQEHDAIRLNRLGKRNGRADPPLESQLAFVVRISGLNDLHPRSKNILNLLKLKHLNTAVFLSLNKTTVGLLKIVEPYITWGIPSLAVVRELIYKKGYGQGQGRQKVPLTDNAVIEKELGEQDIICMEDLVHEIATVGPGFKFASNFLLPFKLSSPNSGWRRKRHFKDGGDFGYRGTDMDSLVKQLI